MTEGTSDISSQAQGQVVDSANPQTEQQKQPKVFYQEDVDRLIGTTKHVAKQEGYAQAMRDQEMKMQTDNAQKAQQMQQQPQMAQQQMQQPGQQQMVGGMQQQPAQPNQNFLTPEDAKKMFSEEIEKQKRDAVLNQVATDFRSKLNAGSSKYPDFDEKVAPLRDMFEKGQLPHIVWLANGADNTADVVYDLANNTHKIGTISSNYAVSPQLGQLEMQRLSNSIKANEAAKQEKTPSEPLSRVQPSVSGTAGSGSPQSVQDFRRMLKV